MLRRLVLVLAVCLPAACLIEGVSFEDGASNNVDGGDAARTDGSAQVDGNVVTVPTDATTPLDAADAKPPATIYARVDSSAGSAGQSCNTQTCNAAQHCCVTAASPNDSYCQSIGIGCTSNTHPDFRCDDPFDCAASAKGCCATEVGSIIAGSTCQTTCAIWLCVSQADCPSGTTCQKAPLVAPPTYKACIPN